MGAIANRLRNVNDLNRMGLNSSATRSSYGMTCFNAVLPAPIPALLEERGRVRRQLVDVVGRVQ